MEIALYKAAPKILDLPPLRMELALLLMFNKHLVKVPYVEPMSIRGTLQSLQETP
ncbi:UNVERIFIED_CONTAM: hypothetical protein Sradi_5424000 [Sesamum radiatum]|uniref:Uncharacterized protein n=1 Tax=Sesamum radiatum TaxID=300843 RepID=A0AAW2LBA4_SESRA